MSTALLLREVYGLVVSRAALHGSLASLRQGAYGEFEAPELIGIIEPAADLQPTPSLLEGRHLILFMDSDPLSASAMSEWSTLLTSVRGALPLDVHVVPVASLEGSIDTKAPSIAPAAGFRVLTYKRASALTLFAKVGLSSIPTALMYSDGKLRCALSGQSSTSAYQQCLALLSDSGKRGPLLQYGQGRALLPPLSKQNISN